MDAPTLAKIFTGLITRWDDPAIAALNGSMPAEDIHVIYRSDESGTTANFQQYRRAASEGRGTTCRQGVSRRSRSRSIVHICSSNPKCRQPSTSSPEDICGIPPGDNATHLAMPQMERFGAPQFLLIVCSREASSATREAMSSRTIRILSMPSIPRSDGSSVSQFSIRVPDTAST
jgi:PBP superfamily domain